MPRAPQPTALKLLKGTRSDRINHAEPKPAAGRPECPAHFDDDTRAEWGRLCDQLQSMGVLNASHGFALAVYCSAYSRLTAAQRSIAADGMFVESGGTSKTSPNGTVTETHPCLKSNPAINVAARAEAIMLRVLTEFGLTAASCLKVSAEKPQDDAFAAFIARRKGGDDGTPSR